MENKRKEFLSRLVRGNFKFVTLDGLRRTFYKPLSDVKESDLSRLDLVDLIIYDLGNGYGVEVSTGIKLPLLNHSNNTLDDLKVGDEECTVFFFRSNDSKKVSFEEYGYYISKNPLTKDTVLENYNDKLSYAKNDLSIFRKVYLKKGDLRYITFEGIEYLKDKPYGFIPASLNTKYITKSNNKVRPLVVLKSDTRARELITGYEMPIIGKDNLITFDDECNGVYIKISEGEVSKRDLEEYSTQASKVISELELLDRLASFNISKAKLVSTAKIDGYIDEFLEQIKTYKVE